MSDESFLNSLDSIETETVNEALRKILPDFVNIIRLQTSLTHLRSQILKIKLLY